MAYSLKIPLQDFGVGQPEEDPRVQQLRMKHPLWEQYSPRWSFYLDSYVGGEEFANRDNLFRHFRENERDFDDRVDRLHNMNYCEPLVDFFTNFIFSESIDRNGGSNKAFYDDFVTDVNLKGDNVDDFMRQVCDDMQIFGMSYVLVDAPQLPMTEDPNAVISKQTEKDLNIRPYWVLIKPEEIIDWVVDQFDNFAYIKRLQLELRKVDGEWCTVEHYTEFYNAKVVISEVKVNKKNESEFLGSTELPNPAGEIPIKMCRYKRDKKNPHMGLSFLRDFAYNQREVMNLTSLLQEFLYRQAFNILAKEVDSGIPLKEQEDGLIGTSNVLEVPKGVTHFPQYISPPAEPAKFIQDERGRIINAMYLRAAQDAISELFNGEKQSGFAQAQSFYKTVPFISSRADALERMENSLMTVTMKLMGKDWDGKVRYKDRYEITNLTDALTQLQILARDLQLPSPTFIKNELKRMIREYDGKLPVDILAQVEKEIDDMNFADWQATQKYALVGNEGTSPGDQQKPKDTLTLRETTEEAKVNTGATVKVRS